MTKTLQTGETFYIHDELPWRDADGERHIHRYTLRAEVASVTPERLVYVCTETVDESGRPPFVVGLAVQSGEMRTESVPYYFGTGRFSR